MWVEMVPEVQQWWHHAAVAVTIAVGVLWGPSPCVVVVKP